MSDEKGFMHKLMKPSRKIVFTQQLGKNRIYEQNLLTFKSLLAGKQFDKKGFFMQNMIKKAQSLTKKKNLCTKLEKSIFTENQKKYLHSKFNKKALISKI